MILYATERTTARYRVRILDDGDPPQPIPRSAFQTFTLTLYNADAPGQAILNDRDHVPVFDLPEITYDEVTGRLVWTMQPEDNAIVDPCHAYERHVARFDWVYGERGEGHHEVSFVVRNISGIPGAA